MELKSNICVTGGEGFLGSYIVGKLRTRGYFNIFIPRHKDYDLRRRDDVIRMYKTLEPNIVIHAAAVCGGIQACSSNPGQFLYDNLIMGLEMMDVARDFSLEKFVQIGSVCSYPLIVPTPTKEEDIWNGYPEDTNAPYGIAKRVLITQAQAYRKQYGLNAINLIPVNMYGPGDTFDPKRSHVIESLIRKCVEAKEFNKDLEVWGTGTVSREFLYVEDCAEAIVLATEKYNKPNPINIGTGVETHLRDLVQLVVEATGFTGKVLWDDTKPEGQLRRLFDVSQAAEEFGFRANVGLEEGIKRTVDWYLSHV